MLNDWIDEQNVWFKFDEENHVYFYHCKGGNDDFEEVKHLGISDFIVNAYNACLPACGAGREQYDLDWNSAVGRIRKDFPATAEFFTSIGYDISSVCDFPALDEMDSVINLVQQYAPSAEVKKAIPDKTDNTQEYVLQQAVADRIAHTMETKLVWSDNYIFVYYHPYSFAQIVLLAVSTAISKGLPLVKICVNCSKAFLPRHRADEIFCSDKCKKQHYKRVNPLMGKIDARQNMIRREINRTRDPRRMQKLNEAYEQWNRNVRQGLEDKQTAVRSRIRDLVWNGEEYDLNMLSEVVEFTDEIKAEWERCKHDAGVQ